MAWYWWVYAVIGVLVYTAVVGTYMGGTWHEDRVRDRVWFIAYILLLSAIWPLYFVWAYFYGHAAKNRKPAHGG